MTAFIVTQLCVAGAALAVIVVAVACTGAWLCTWRMPAELEQSA
jgi:hypothetical protein